MSAEEDSGESEEDEEEEEVGGEGTGSEGESCMCSYSVVHTLTHVYCVRELALFQVAVRIKRRRVMERTQVEHMALIWIQTVRSAIHGSVY